MYPPTQVQILSFSCSFLQKICKNNRFAHPLWELTPPQENPGSTTDVDPGFLRERQSQRHERGTPDFFSLHWCYFLGENRKKSFPTLKKFQEFWTSSKRSESSDLPFPMAALVGPRDALPSRSNIFNFHAVFGKNLFPKLRGWGPRLGNPWIRHWTVNENFYFEPHINNQNMYLKKQTTFYVKEINVMFNFFPMDRGMALIFTTFELQMWQH